MSEETIGKEGHAAQARSDSEAAAESSSPAPQANTAQAKSQKKQGGDLVGLISRLDFGGPGYRKGLVVCAFDLLKQESAPFNILAGGLIDHKEVYKGFQKDLKEALEEARQGNESHRLSATERQEIKDTVWKKTVEKWARKIAKTIPPPEEGDRKPVKTYIVTSSYYDGEIGRDIAVRLAELRKRDIIFWGDNEARFTLKRTGKVMVVRCPEKAPWRGEYYSTPVTREVTDSMAVSAIALPDFYVVGCVGSSIYKPQGGESKRPYLSTPVCHKLRTVHTRENQIGVRIVEMRPDGMLFVRTYNLKDAVMSERDSIRIPEDCDEKERAAVELLKKHGGMTSGQIRGELNVSRDEVKRIINGLIKKFKGRIVRDYPEGSGRVDFSPKYLQEELTHHFPNKANLLTDTVMTGGCWHAGHPKQHRPLLLQVLPKTILAEGAKTLAIVGDIIVGLFHRLMIRDEVYGGMNYTRQERYAAWIVARIVLTVFYARFTAAMAALKKTPVQAELRQLVSDTLLRVRILIGNHDSWPKNDGFDPLQLFYARVVDLVTHEIRQLLKQKYDLYLEIGLRQMVREHIQICEKFSLPDTGVNVHMSHPSMGRTKTITIRLQECLNQDITEDCPIELEANFHVGVCLEQWEPDLGQRIGHQVGTALIETEFERGKLKDNDVHVGLVRVWVRPERVVVDGKEVTRPRVYVSEQAYFTAPPLEKPLDNNDILAALESESLIPADGTETKKA